MSMTVPIKFIPLLPTLWKLKGVLKLKRSRRMKLSHSRAHCGEQYDCLWPLARTLFAMHGYRQVLYMRMYSIFFEWQSENSKSHRSMCGTPVPPLRTGTSVKVCTIWVAELHGRGLLTQILSATLHDSCREKDLLIHPKQHFVLILIFCGYPVKHCTMPSYLILPFLSLPLFIAFCPLFHLYFLPSDARFEVVPFFLNLSADFFALSDPKFEADRKNCYVHVTHIIPWNSLRQRRDQDGEEPRRWKRCCSDRRRSFWESTPNKDWTPCRLLCKFGTQIGRPQCNQDSNVNNFVRRTVLRTPARSFEIM